MAADSSGSQEIERRRGTDLRARSKAGAVILVALAAAALGFVIFTTLWLALLIGLFTLFVALPIAFYTARRRMSSSGRNRA
jgi:ABC-type Fe3+ transport system permease subunit